MSQFLVFLLVVSNSLHQLTQFVWETISKISKTKKKKKKKQNLNDVEMTTQNILWFSTNVLRETTFPFRSFFGFLINDTLMHSLNNNNNNNNNGKNERERSEQNIGENTQSNHTMSRTCTTHTHVDSTCLWLFIWLNLQLSKWQLIWLQHVVLVAAAAAVAASSVWRIGIWMRVRMYVFRSFARIARILIEFENDYWNFRYYFFVMKRFAFTSPSPSTPSRSTTLSWWFDGFELSTNCRMRMHLFATDAPSKSKLFHSFQIAERPKLVLKVNDFDFSLNEI